MGGRDECAGVGGLISSAVGGGGGGGVWKISWMISKRTTWKARGKIVETENVKCSSHEPGDL